MRKRYEKLSVTLLGFAPEEKLLQASIVTEEAMVSTTGQKTESYDFSDSDTFNTDWE